MTASLASVHQERAGAATVQAGGPRVTASQEVWNAHDPSGGVIKDKISSTQAFLLTRGGKGIAQPAATTGTVSLQGVF
jgi:hypothetical protein